MNGVPPIPQNTQSDNNWLHLLLENGPNLVSYIGADRRHRYVNSAYAKWFKRAPEDIINKTLREIANSAEGYALTEHYELRALAGERVSFVVDIPASLRSEVDSFESSYIPHIDPLTGQVLGVVLSSYSRMPHQRAIDEKVGTEQRFRALTNTLPQLLWTAKANGELDYVNKRCFEYTGASDKSFSQAWLESIHPEERTHINKRWVESLRLGAPFKEQYRLRGVDGCYRWFMGHSVPIRSERGEIEYWIGTATDIEEERRRENELNKAKIAAEDANHAKSAFLANMSHELRTPLNAVLGFSNLLKDNSLSAENRNQFIDAIERSGKMLTRLIDDLLDLSRIEAGRVVIDKVRFAPRELLRDIVKLFRDKVTEKRITLSLEIDPGVPNEIESDPVRLRQILINVIGNAVKFTENGGVFIRLTAQGVEGSSGQVKLLFEVDDTGCGFTDEQREQIFTPFFQADATNARRYGGAGLGLTISNRLAGALGGEIKVTRHGLNQGSTFLVTISVKDSGVHLGAPLGEIADSKSMIQNPLKGLRCLVVDDSEDNQLLTKYILESEGAYVDVASSGFEALIVLEKNNCDLVLLDIQMPGMDGYQTLQALRTKGFRMPVVALTAHAMSEDKSHTKAAGFTHHLTKPLNFDELIRVVSVVGVTQNLPSDISPTSEDGSGFIAQI